MSGGHVYVDETKRRGYLLAAAVVVPPDLDGVRQVLRGPVLPGQRRLHMKDENDQRRRSIATAIAVSGVTATIDNAGRRYDNERERRAACLPALVADAARRGDAVLVLEHDDTLLSWATNASSRPRAPPDTATLFATNTAPPPASCYSRYPTPSPSACRAKGGDWRRRIEPVVSEIREV